MHDYVAHMVQCIPSVYKKCSFLFTNFHKHKTNALFFFFSFLAEGKTREEIYRLSARGRITAIKIHCHRSYVQIKPSYIFFSTFAADWKLLANI